MPRLSREEKELVERFANRHAALIYAMTEGSDRLTGMSPEAFSELYKKVMADDDGQMILPDLADLEEFTVRMENKVDEFRQGNTHEHAMRMMKAANSGAMMMNNHMRYNYPRLASAARVRMTEIHHTAYRRRWESMGILLPDGRVKIGDNVSLNPIGNFQPYGKDPTLFDSPDANRNRSKWKQISFNTFEAANDEDLFNNIFYVADSPDDSSFSAFEVLSFKRTANGNKYDIRWEGTSHEIEMIPAELKERAELGLWMTPKPKSA